VSDRPDHMAEPTQPPSAWNIANALTVVRLLLVPVFALFLLYDDGRSGSWRLAALATFLAASVTDTVDGELARRRGLVTDFGTIADPIADKALMGAALVGLSVLDELSWPVTIVVLGREIGVTLLRFWVIRHGVIPASPGGKVKTMLQMLAISLYILPLEGLLAQMAALVMGVAVLVTVVTGLDYVLRAARVRRDSERTATRRARKAPPRTGDDSP
jgi:CDP-diacylglycerol--glycerol-3-phosphate 3-phosphatidyltransferase